MDGGVCSPTKLAAGGRLQGRASRAFHWVARRRSRRWAATRIFSDVLPSDHFEFLSRPLRAYNWPWLPFLDDREHQTPEAFLAKYLGYNSGLPAWLDDTCQPWTDDIPKRRGKRWSVETRGFVEIEHLVGTVHIGYGGCSWRLLAQGTRKPDNLHRALGDPIGFAKYLVSAPAEFHFHQIDGQVYIANEGNNRLIAARFMGVRRAAGMITLHY